MLQSSLTCSRLLTGLCEAYLRLNEIRDAFDIMDECVCLLQVQLVQDGAISKRKATTVALVMHSAGFKARSIGDVDSAM